MHHHTWNFWRILIGGVCLLTVVACQSGGGEEKSTPKAQAVTTFGKSVEAAEDLSDSSDMRNEEVDRQADQLFSDE